LSTRASSTEREQCRKGRNHRCSRCVPADRSDAGDVPHARVRRRLRRW
jgi:hypothetical protein